MARRALKCCRCGQETLTKTGERFPWRDKIPVDGKLYWLWSCPCGNAVGRKNDGSSSKDKKYLDKATV